MTDLERHEPSIPVAELNAAELNTAEFVNQTALMIGLPIPPEYHQSVVDNFGRIAAIAQLVLEFPLPTDIEIAPVFQPHDPNLSGRY